MWDLFLPIHTNAYLKVENMPAIGFEIKRKCKVCGEVFLAKTLDSQYCSPKCSKVAWKRKKDAKEKNEKLNRLAQHIPLSADKERYSSCHQRRQAAHPNQTLSLGNDVSHQKRKSCRKRETCAQKI